MDQQQVKEVVSPEVATVEEVESDDVVATMQKQIEALQQSLDEKQQVLDETYQTQTELNKQLFEQALTQKGLQGFLGVFELGEGATIEQKLETLQQAVNGVLVANSYQPKEVAQQEAYTQALNEGNVNKALDFKFSRLFGKK